MNTFKSVDTEDIKDLNNHLLTTQLDYFQNFIYKETKLTEKEEELSETRDFIIHSLRRKILTYKIHLDIILESKHPVSRISFKLIK